MKDSPIRLTISEFDSCKLPHRLSFPLSEACRLVLVHNMSIEVAAGVVGLREEGDIEAITQSVQLFLDEYAASQFNSGSSASIKKDA